MSKLLCVFIFCALLLHSCVQLCQSPQKGLYMSFNALSKRDSLPNVFHEINNKTSKYNMNYTQNKLTYRIMNMHPQLYYNEHHQKQVFVDEQRLNVTLGDTEFAYRFDYQIVNADTNTTSSGWARGRALLEQQRYFIKRIYSNEGKLQWQPQQVQDLHLVYPISIEYASPDITQPQKLVFQGMMNGYVGEEKLKQTIMSAFNEHYKSILKSHLNHEDLVNDLEFDYKYGNISISFTNAWISQSHLINQNKGLQVFYLLEVKDTQTGNCTSENITFSDQNRGLQEVIAIAQLQNGFLQALKQGLCDVKLDKSWEVPEFQFYMGDLGRAFEAAYKYNPGDAFQVECKWNKDEKSVKVTNYPNHQLYVSLQQVCTIGYSDKDLFKFTADLSFSAVIRPQTSSLDLVLNGANTFMPNFVPIDPEFVVNQSNLARNAISVVLQGMIGKKTIGSGWPTYSRRFPVVKVDQNFLTLFDPSQL